MRLPPNRESFSTSRFGRCTAIGEVSIKRVYEEADKEDGVRILVDRLWPRGVNKEAAALNGWLKDVVPSPGLRTWGAGLSCMVVY